MSRHTKEPWYVGEKAEIDGDWITADRCVGGYTGRDEYNRENGVWALYDGEPDTICAPWYEADARRIVACVNACAGLTPEQVKALPRLVAWFKERDVSWDDETWDSKTDELHRIFPEDSK